MTKAKYADYVTIFWRRVYTESKRTKSQKQVVAAREKPMKNRKNNPDPAASPKALLDRVRKDLRAMDIAAVKANVKPVLPRFHITRPVK